MIIARPRQFPSQARSAFAHGGHLWKQAHMLQPRRRVEHYPLRRKSQIPMWVSITWRVAFAFGLVGLAVGVHWVEREGLRDNVDGHISFADVVYFTMISITTTGYGDIVPVTEQGRLFDALVVTPIRVFIILIFLGTAYNFVLKRTWERWRMSVIQKNLRDHVIVAGYGVTGAQVVDELIERGAKPRGLVVVDCDAEALERAQTCGCATIQGDATRDRTLQDVRIDRARAIIISAGSDDTSILITLTARHLVPSLPISIAVRNADNELLARQAGATTVINPISFAGILLAGSSEGPLIADYVADLASSAGRVKLVERPVREDEWGKPLSGVSDGLGVLVYRNDTPNGFWSEEAQLLMPGDQIVEIIPTPGRGGDDDEEEDEQERGSRS
jgi:voltage-gated potassium channel